MSEWGDKIPNGWGSAEIQEIGEVVTGSTPAKKDADNYDGGDIPFYKPTDLNAGYFVKGSNDRLTEKGANLARVFPVGSVMVTCIGATIGKTGLARTKGASNQQINTIIPSDKVNSEYLYWLLSSPLGQNSIIDNANATTLPILNKGKFSKLRIPIAPLPEQRRIVSKIEELFSKLDAGVAALKQAKAQLKRYRQSVLAAAVTGELTKEWRTNNPNTEPASKLLERILKQRREQWSGKRKYKEPAAPTVEDLPEIPASWTWGSPSQLSAPEDYSLAIGPFGSNLKVSDYTDTGVPLVFVRHIRANDYKLTSKYVSNEKALELRAHSVDPGDLLITKMGEPPGDAALYPDNRPHAIITADCIKLRLTHLISAKLFFVNAINSRLVARQITPITRGVAQKKISLDRFRDIALPLPPLDEQTQIVAEVEARTTTIDHIETELDQQLTRANKLRHSILSSAFSGKI